jgi:hypothetical protein
MYILVIFLILLLLSLTLLNSKKIEKFAVDGTRCTANRTCGVNKSCVSKVSDGNYTMGYCCATGKEYVNNKCQ